MRLYHQKPCFIRAAEKQALNLQYKALKWLVLSWWSPEYWLNFSKKNQCVDKFAIYVPIVIEPIKQGSPELPSKAS